jgi:cysteine desulfurase
MRRVYLDYAATTPLDPEVFRAMEPYFTDRYGNASSLHHFGREARAALDESRETIAHLIGAQAGEVLFVSSGTEADNFALKGIAAGMVSRGKNHIITDSAEHHAVLEPCAFLGRNGFSVTTLPVDDTGRVDPHTLGKGVRPQTGLVSVMHANNEVGTINPIADIARVARANGIVMHTDAVQSFGKIPVNVDDLGVDLLSLSAHKIYGPKGIGALYVRKGVGIERFMHGGGQERGRRAGTENVPLAVGFARAAVLAYELMEATAKASGALRDRLTSRLRERFPYILLNGPGEDVLPAIVNISFDSRRIEIDGESLLFNLDLAGVAAASGSACTSGSMEPSHVLLAMGRDMATAKASVRFSIGRMTGGEEIDYAVDALEEVVRRIGKQRN